MALTDEPVKKKNPLLTGLKILLVVIPTAAFSIWGYQQYEKYKGVQVYRTAFQYELEYAELGVLNSQVFVARAYDEGFQTEVNKAEAVKWYTKAATQSHAEAQYQLGQHYLNGEGVARDDKEGFVWIQRASFKEYAPAEYRLGQLYCEGRGVEANCAEGIKQIEKAAGRGYQAAQTELADRLENGDGLPADPVRAYVLFAMAHEARFADEKNIPASPDLQRLELRLTPEQLAEARKAFEAQRTPVVKTGRFWF
ncbi:MAG: tetratricopeptide repeat protein [Asticcacaulis sp.]